MATDNAPAERQGRFRPFMREHRIICALLVAGAFVRVIVMLAYPPAFWFSDSVAYIHAALVLNPNPVRPIGYSFFLLLLKPYHSFFLVAAVQHVLGLAMGVEVYALLRRLNLPAWGSVLAAVPPLFSAYGLQIEHYVLSDTLFGFLITTALAALLWRPVPRLWVCAGVGLLLAWSVVDRSQGILLVVPFVLYLVVSRLGLRGVLISAVTLCVTALVPVAAYAWWYDQSYGSFQITSSTGAFLYSRVATFAQCSMIQPPRNEQFLCIDEPVGKRKYGSWYIWSPASPIQHGPAPVFSSKFDPIATDFALRAISAQPTDYLRAVWSSTADAFVPAGDANGTGRYYAFPRSLAASWTYARSVIPYSRGANPNTRVVQPFAGWLLAYQRFVALPGPLLGLIAAVGLLGTVLGWRRFGRQTLLAWLTGVVLIVTPAATADYDARYVVAAVPAFCIAGALGARELWRFVPGAVRRRSIAEMPEPGTG